jgi:hypothetical protein
VALSPDQWLDRLTTRMDYRAPRLALLRSYMDGCAPLPEGAEGCRDAYQQFQKKARTNFGELIIEAVTDRMIPSGFRVGSARQDDDRARAIWKRNRLQMLSTDVHGDMLGLSVGYAMAQPSKRGAVVTRERPEQVITEQDAARPDLVRAGLKAYRDSLAGFDTALLHVPGVMHTYRRPLRDDLNRPLPLVSVRGGWEYVGAVETGLDVVPIVPFINRRELGEFETHTDVLDRINWLVLQELVTIAMQAYRQRAMKGDLPENDEAGNEIDYGEMFAPGPGSLWKLPDDVDLWESAALDIPGVLQPADKHIRNLGAVTRTPLAVLMPDSANQTAAGANNQKEGGVNKARDRVQRAGASWDTIMGIALALEAGQSTPVEDVETLWLPVEQQSLAERADAASKAQDVPWRTRMTDIWQFPADQVDRMETERAADMLDAAMQAPPTIPPVTPPASGNAG